MEQQPSLISQADQRKLQTKKAFKRIIALSLIISPLIHTYLSIKDILFVLPKISFVGDPQTSNQLYAELLKKAVTISFNLIFNTIYGFSLLIKPILSTTAIHLIIGVILFIISNFLFQLTAIDKLFQQLPFLPLTWSLLLDKKPLIAKPVIELLISSEDS